MQHGRTQVQIDRLAAALRTACGPEMIDALNIEDLEDLALNPDGVLWRKRRSANWEVHCDIDEFRAYEIVTSVAAIKGREVTAERPIIETVFPLDESRFEAVVPPVSRRAVFSLRKRGNTKRRLINYVVSGVLTDKDDPANERQAREDFIALCEGKAHGEILALAIDGRKNIVFAGPPGSGKTTLADAVCTEIGERTPDDRIVYIEDVPEMECDAPNAVDLLTNDNVDLLKCVRTAMRLRASRIIVGEVRGAEAYPLLKAWMTGHPGGLATVHADSAYGALTRLEALTGEATAAPAQDLIAQAVDLVVYIEAEPRVACGRKVKEVLAVKAWDKTRGRYEVESL